MPIRVCFFDMGNVLVTFSHERMLANVATVTGWTIEQARRFLFAEGRQWQMERGELSEAELHAQLAAATGRAIPPGELHLALADIFEVNDSIVPLLHELRVAGQRLILLSNTSRTHMEFIEHRFDVLSLIDERITSFTVGAMKPDPRIFETALRLAGCPAEECFYTDDIAEYVEAFGRFGVHSHVFHSVDGLRRELFRLTVLKPVG
jgi:putative hydrolase of the HAD superfamily